MEDNQFEQKVSLEMGSFKLKPSDAVWQNVEAQLIEDKKRRRWVFLLLFAGLLVGGGAAVYITSDKQSATATVAQAPLNKTANEPIQQQTPATTPVISNEQSSIEKKGTNTTIAVAEKNTNDVAVSKPANKHTKSALMNTVKTKRTSFKQQPALLQTNGHKQSTVLVNSNEPVVVTERKTEIPVADTTASVQTQSGEINTAVAVAENNTTTNSDSSVIKINSTNAVDTATVKKKWQLGVQFNTGIAQIRENIFPGAAFATADASPLFGNNGAPGGATRITVNQFAIKPSLQFGAGLVLRHSIFKKHSFVTGLQYQYSSYVVLQKQRVDSFMQTTSTFSTVMSSESSARFTTHSIAVPLDIEWKIASTAKGMFRVGTGLQQWFSIASSQQGNPSSAFRYSNATAGTVKVRTWQPVLQLSPVYEWKTKERHISQLGLYFNYGLRPVYSTSTNARDYWWQTGLRYRLFINR
jgi:hypothetical protein